MQSFLFSINATLPIFFVMAIGYLLRRGGVLNASFVDTLNTLNYKVMLPVMLFTDMAGADFFAVWDTRYVLFCCGATLLCFFAILAVGWLFFRGKSLLGEFVQGSFRSSAAVLGLAFVQNVYGTSTIAPLMILGAVPLYNVLSVCVLTFTDPNNEGKADWKRILKALRGVVTNPIILGIAAGFAASLLRLDLPVIVDKTLNYFAIMATPTALLALGGGFEGKKALSQLKPTIAASFIKLIAQGLVLIPLAVWMGFRDEKLLGILIMLCAPTTVSCFIMAKNMHHEAVLTSSVVVTTTFLSSVTLTGWLYVLRCFDYL